MRKCHKLGGLNNRNVFLTVLESGESKIKVLADWVSGESSLGWQTAASWPCPHIMERERKEARSLGGFSFNGSNPIMRVPPL